MGRRRNGEGSMSSKPDKNGFYHCYLQTKVVNDNGNYVRVHGQGKTQEEASKDAKKKKRNIEREKLLDIDKNFSRRKTFGSYMQDFMDYKVETKDAKMQIAESTYGQYINELRSCFFVHKISKLQPTMLNQNDFKEYYEYLDERYPNNPHKRKSIRGHCINCLLWLNTKGFSLEVEMATIPQVQAKKLDNIAEDAIAEFKEMMFKENEKEAFTEEEIKAFEQAHIDRFCKYTGFFCLQMCLGLRAQELFAIIPELDFDRERRILYIYKAVGRKLKSKDKTTRRAYLKCCKNRDKRIIFVDDFALEYLDWCIEQTKRNTKENPLGLLICNWENGGYVRLDNYNDSLKRLARKYNIEIPPKRASHMFRKTWATYNSLRPNISPLLVAKGTGHHDMDVLFNNYIKPTIGQLSTLQSPFMILEDKYNEQYEKTGAFGDRDKDDEE